MAKLQKSVVISVIVMFCISSCFAAVYIQQAPEHPDHGKCYDKITKRTLLPGKEFKPKGICAVIKCNCEQSVVEAHTCPLMEVPGCIELSANMKLSYPKCCPQYLCSDENGNEIILDVFSS